MEHTFDVIADAVFTKRPILKHIIQEHGDKSLFDYVQSWPCKRGKDSLFIECFSEYAIGLYPQDAGSIVNQLLQTSMVSTIDHHGILNHPIFINSNLIHSLQKDLRYIIVLPTTGVSMNNSSSYSGSLVASSEHGGRLRRASLFPASLGMHPVFSMPSFNQKNIEFVSAHISKSGIFNTREQKILLEAVEKHLRPAIGHKTFSDQAADVSMSLWGSYFPKAPQLIYIPLEPLVSLVVRKMLEERHSLCTFLFLETQGLDLVEKYFQNVGGAFSGPDKGSFLFWGLDAKGKRVHLRREGGKLVGEEFSMELTSDALESYLRDGLIYPTSLVCFLILLYYNITCLGGFNQTTWLSEIKQRFYSLLQELGQQGAAEEVAVVASNIFAETNVAFLRGREQWYSASGMDVLFQENDQLYEQYCQLAHQMTVRESLETMLPEIYRIIIPHHEQIQNIVVPQNPVLEQKMVNSLL